MCGGREDSQHGNRLPSQAARAQSSAMQCNDPQSFRRARPGPTEDVFAARAWAVSRARPLQWYSLQLTALLITVYNSHPGIMKASRRCVIAEITRNQLVTHTPYTYLIFLDDSYCQVLFMYLIKAPQSQTPDTENFLILCSYDNRIVNSRRCSSNSRASSLFLHSR